MPFESELETAVASQSLTLLRSILSRPEVKANGNLNRAVWLGNIAPLHRAAWIGNREAVQVLVDAGVDINSFKEWNGFRSTALHYAVYCDNVPTVKLLLDLGADPRLKGNYKQNSGSVLDLAKQKNLSGIIKLLEEKKKIDGKGTDGKGGGLSLRSMIERLESKNATLETLAKARKIKRTIEVMEQSISALKTDGDYRTDEDIGKLQEEVREVERLIAAVRKQLEPEKPETEDIRSCPVCTEAPKEVFVCQECDNWVCGVCKDQLAHCPSCWQDFEERPPRRNRAIELAFGI